MNHDDIRDADLLAYLDESLSLERLADLEAAIRDSAELRQRAALLARRRDQGGHTITEIWRRWRISCPSRNQLGTFLLGAAEPQHADYVEFHLSTVGCRFCQANVADLKRTMKPEPETVARRRRFFESSAGLIRKSE